MSKSIKFLSICIFLLIFTSCATLSTRMVTCEEEIFSKSGEINNKQRLALGEKIYSDNYDRVFTSCITGLAQLGLSVKNMERQSGYILGEGPMPIPVKKYKELMREYMDELSACGRKWSFSPGNGQFSFTLTILKLNELKTKVKLRISMIALSGNYKQKYFSICPKVYEKMYINTWESIEKQIFMDKNLDKNNTEGKPILNAN